MKRSIAAKKRKELGLAMSSNLDSELRRKYFRQWAFDPVRIAGRLLKFGLSAQGMSKRAERALMAKYFAKFNGYRGRGTTRVLIGMGMGERSNNHLRRRCFLTLFGFSKRRKQSKTLLKCVERIGACNKRVQMRIRYGTWQALVRERRSGGSSSDPVLKKIAAIKAALASLSNESEPITPREKQLDEENDQLHQEIADLDTRILQLEEQEKAMLAEYYRVTQAPVQSSADDDEDNCEQTRMLDTFTLLKAKSVMCGRDLKDIGNVREGATKAGLDNSDGAGHPILVFAQGVKQCAEAIHAACKIPYTPYQAAVWPIDMSLIHSFPKDTRKQILGGIRMAVIARDTLLHRERKISHKIRLDHTREIMANLGIMIACVDTFCLGHDFYTSEGQGNSAASVNREPSPPTGFQAFLGMNAVTQRDAVVLKDVLASGPAYECGMRVGDIITEINGRKVANRSEFLTAVKEMATNPGDPLHFKIIPKDGKGSKIVSMLAQERK
jgi:hypothetical protein